MDFGFDFNFDDAANGEGFEVPEVSGEDMSGMDDWGTSLSSFFDAPIGKKKNNSSKQKPKTQKEKSNSANSKSADKKQRDEDVTLPVTILARGFKTKVEGTGTMKLPEIGGKLIKDGYNQFLIPGMALSYEKATNLIYVCDGNVRSTSDDTMIDLSDGQTITVIDGQLSATFSAEDFPQKEEDEISAKDIAEQFARVNPLYKGCNISYLPDCEYAYPVFDVCETANIASPVSLMLGGDVIEYEDGIDSLKGLKEKAFGNTPTGLSAVIYKTGKTGICVAGFTSYSAYQVTQIAHGGSKAATAKVEQKYTLPIELYIVTFNTLYNLTSEQFGGKEKVTLKEITTYMSDTVSMFKDKSRKIDSLYSKEMNRLAVMFVSGSKGCELIRTEEELAECRRKEQFHGIYPSKDGAVQLLALPHGNFFSLMGKGRDLCSVVDISFERKLPKIPKELLCSIISYFKEDLGSEAMVRVVYNKEKDEFSFYKAGGSKGRAYINYEFSASAEYMNPNMVQVMEIHSHNTMPAFFSYTDDEDEKGYPGVFGVIGYLDRKEPAILFRVGVDGLFKEIPVPELFDVAV